ncbi:hypothetical protein [Fibrobacter sp.]|uniref:hypothetical protein n=1 Tax=Fibrobacter sp. TaxID=35828 RepID=UPI003890C870
MKRNNLFVAILLAVFLLTGNSFAQAAAPAAGGFTGVATADQSATGIRTPLFLGAALGFGSGTGVGTSRGLGLRQIEPMIGVWLPGIGFLRAGYGFSNYEEDVENGDDAEVEHSDFDIELGVHLLGELYVTGAYSRVKELSDVGDVAWNEWGAGFGTLLNIFSKTMLFAEVSYRWVLDHYDPFMDKDVSGSRLQFNIGFASYVF